MKLIVRKDIYDEIMKSYIKRWGIPGHYRYKYYEPDTGCRRGGGLTKQNSNIDQTKLDAIECNNSIELRNIPILNVDKNNYFQTGKDYINMLNKNYKGIKCKGTNKTLAEFTYKHLYKNTRTIDERILRTKLLPYVIPTILKGKKGNDSRQMDHGNSICMLSKVEYIDNNIKNKVGLKVVLAPNKFNQLEVDFISLITIESPLIKSTSI